MMYSIYSTTDGLFTGARLSKEPFDQAWLDDHTPAGCATYPGEWDMAQFRMNLTTHFPFEFQPDAPPDDDDQTWEWHATPWRWVSVPTLSAARRTQWALVREGRDAVVVGGFVWDGSTFDSDPDSQTRIIGGVQMAQIVGSSFTIDWTLQDDTTRTLSDTDMVAVALAMGTFMQGVFGRGRDLLTAIDAATTVAAVLAIVWYWP